MTKDCHDVIETREEFRNRTDGPTQLFLLLLLVKPRRYFHMVNKRNRSIRVGHGSIFADPIQSIKYLALIELVNYVSATKHRNADFLAW